MLVRPAIVRLGRDAYPRLGRASVVMFNRSAMSDERVLDRLDATLIGDAKGGR